MFWCKFLVSLLAGLVLADVQTCTDDSCDGELASDFAAAVRREGPEESLELLQVKQAESLEAVLTSSANETGHGRGRRRGRRRRRRRRRRRHRRRRGRGRRRRRRHRGRRRRRHWRRWRPWQLPWQCRWRPDLCYLYDRVGDF
eukprot:symbB.v1.2.009841.t1/scaffold628.1/size179110/4